MDFRISTFQRISCMCFVNVMHLTQVMLNLNEEIQLNIDI